MLLFSLLYLAIANFSLTDASLNNEQKAFDGDTRYVVLKNNKSFYDQVDNRRILPSGILNKRCGRK